MATVVTLYRWDDDKGRLSEVDVARRETLSEVGQRIEWPILDGKTCEPLFKLFVELLRNDEFQWSIVEGNVQVEVDDNESTTEKRNGISRFITASNWERRVRVGVLETF